MMFLETEILSNIAISLAAADTLDEIKAIARTTLSSINVDYFTVYSYKYYAETIYVNSIIENQSDYHFPENKKFEFKNNSSLGQKALIADAPFFWTADVFNPNLPIDKELSEYYAAEGVAVGYCIPITRSSTARTIIHFGFPPDVPKQPEGWFLHAIGLMINFAIMRLRFLAQHKRSWIPKQRSVPLSKREVQTISWIALGKSSWETSKILGISEHTVNDHIERAVRKLGASNRTEAVAAAIMTGQVDFTSFDQANP
ncbi:MAG: helix-turn-helix transcriptional regulator [Xanthobacteraceae bacterium]|nr:helix-turn-helix transcriptional regulator [Xanthobacteraceae bacterium]MBY0611664.1 helix-turn-helix transcriptional regulator [Beijerinckiaceae bacterium]